MSIEIARERIADFVGVDAFDEWQPSRRVRIKLLAPGFPKRVLKTVKWLGDVYDMPIEAIEVKLFEDASGCYQLTVERLLPVRGDDAFDLTVRESEAQKQTTNIARRPAVLAALLEHGELQHGQRIDLHPRALYADAQAAFDAGSLVFQVVLDASGASPRFRWRATEDDPEQVLAPSAAWHTMMETVFPGRYDKRYWPVHNSYSVVPEGETLGDLAERTGAWAPRELTHGKNSPWARCGSDPFSRNAKALQPHSSPPDYIRLCSTRTPSSVFGLAAWSSIR